MIATWVSPFSFVIAWVAYVSVIGFNVFSGIYHKKQRTFERQVKDTIIEMQGRSITELRMRIVIMARQIAELQKPAQVAFNPVFQQSEVLREVLEEGRRSLAKKYHPDLPTGNSAKMQQINTVVDKMIWR